MTAAKHPRPPYQPGAEYPDAARRSARRGGETRTIRRPSKGPWRGTILDLMDAAGMVGPEWSPWRAFWCAVYALPMTADELAIYQRHSKRATPPSAQVAEAWMCVGRGGGKTRNSALHATFRAITFDASTVAPGEDVIIPLLATDRRQARQAIGYIRAFNALPLVAPYVLRGALKEIVEYRTGVNVEVQTATKKAPRGYACPTACADEIAFWENEDDHTNPDHEVITAVRGALGRVSDSVLVALSNPYAPAGELFDAVETYYGRDDDDVLVWNADTLSMHPTYDTRAIARAFKRDPVVANSEFGFEGFVAFRQARVALFDAEPVRACTVLDRRELPPVPGTRYYGFVDAAQGARSGDSMTLGIAHREGNRVVLDLVREAVPPFDPGSVIRDRFVPVLHEYGVASVVGDRHALGFVQAEFGAAAVKFIPSTLTKSDIFAELLPLVNTTRVELLDHPTLRTQLLALERRAIRGGKDSIDHPRGAHDDVANAAAGALVAVTGVGLKLKKLVVRMGGEGGMLRIGPGAEERTPEQVKHAAMLDLIAATKARAEKEAAADYALAKAIDGDMSGIHQFLGGSTMTDGTFDALTGGGDDLATRIGEPSPTLERGTTLQRGAER